MELIIKNGVIQTFWKKTGKLKSEISYTSEGLLSGPARFFTESGWLHEEVVYLDDDILSIKLFYSTGQVKLIENYKQGDRHGLSQAFDRKGDLVIEDIYDHNRLSERKIYKLGIYTF